MRKRLTLVLGSVLLLLMVALPVMAIQFGQPDTDPEMYGGVGITMSYPGTGDYVYLCTVSLIDQDTVLTAGHCAYGYDGPDAWTVVGFDQQYPSLGELYLNGIPGTPVPHPQYVDDFANFPATYDVGVINLLEPAPAGLTIWPLAPAGTLDGLATKRGQYKPLFAITGYGVQDALPPLYQDDFERYRGQAKLNNLTSASTAGYNVQISANPGASHSGGTCFGDSGGPVLYEGQIVAVNSFVKNLQCMGNGYGFRVDRSDVQAWIASVDRDLP